MAQLDSIKNNIFGNSFQEYRIKEDGDLLLMYDNNFNSADIRCCILDKTNNEIIAVQTNLIYNDNSKLKDLDWGSVIVEECVDGTTLVVFHHNDQWYITTRKCLDADTSRWNGTSHKAMFLEAIDGKLELDSLSKDRVYYFVLVHHLDKKVVDYTTKYGDKYKEVIHLMTTQKYTFQHVDEEIPNISKVKSLDIKSSKDLFEHLKKMEYQVQTNSNLVDFGVIIKKQENNIVRSILRYEAFTYQDLFGAKPNVRSKFQTFLELYRTNGLSKFLKYQSSEDSGICTFIHSAMQELTKELLSIYMVTRNKGEADFYNKLMGNYKTVLYELHGQFLDKRNKQMTAKLTFVEVYSYLKNYLSLDLFIALVEERKKILESNPDIKNFNKSSQLEEFANKLLNQ